MLSGGSALSWSETWAANTVTEHVSLKAKSTFGLMVKVVGPPVTTVSATLRVRLVGHTVWQQLPLTLTRSWNVTDRLAFTTRCAAELGVVAVTAEAACTVV